MAWIASPGRRAAQRDAGTSGKRCNASGVSSRATEGRVLFTADRVADRSKWETLLRRVRDRGEIFGLAGGLGRQPSPLLASGKNHPGQIVQYLVPLV